MGGDDESLADSLGSVDKVIYDPTVIPTLRDPIREYAPRTAAKLATRFQITQILHPTAAVLEPVPWSIAKGVQVKDLWESFDELHHLLRVHNRFLAGPPDPRRGVEKTNWMMHRVIATLSHRSAVWTCFAIAVSTGPGATAFTLIPMSPSSAACCMVSCNSPALLARSRSTLLALWSGLEGALD